MASGSAAEVFVLQNARSIAILTSYLSLCVFLAGSIIRMLVGKYRRHQPDRNKARVLAFTILSVASLCLTWYHMFRFFAHSYENWASCCCHDPQAGMALGDWLRDTQLFRDAWQTVTMTMPRYLWSHQIFFMALYWSYFMSQEAPRRQISHTRRFMVLGQIVAISFASNLFFLAVVLSPATPDEESVTADAGKNVDVECMRDLEATKEYQERNRTSRWLYSNVIFIFIFSVAMLPTVADTSMFYPLLIVLHVCVFAPLMFGPKVLPQAMAFSASHGEADYHRKVLSPLLTGWCSYSINCAIQVYKEDGLVGTWGALNEHPAVSSVGWDVIMCWISILMWYFTSERKLSGDESEVRLKETKRDAPKQ